MTETTEKESDNEQSTLKKIKELSKESFNLKILRPLGRGFLFTSPLERSELPFFGNSG